MSSLSLTFDTPGLAHDYENRSVTRQFQHGKSLIEDLEIQAGEHVLDIGAGTGLLAEHVAEIVGPTGCVLGIDPLPLRIEIASRRSRPNLKFRVGNAYELEAFSNGRFDVVYLNQVLHWLPEKASPLAQVHRVLKPKGRVGIATGSRNHPGALQTARRRVLSRSPYREHVAPELGAPQWVNVGELAKLLEEAGFEPIKIELQQSVQFQENAELAIEFVESSSFGNFLGHLPEELRRRAFDEITRELEALRTPNGLRFQNHRLVAIARKPDSL